MILFTVIFSFLGEFHSVLADTYSLTNTGQYSSYCSSNGVAYCNSAPYGVYTVYFAVNGNRNTVVHGPAGVLQVYDRSTHSYEYIYCVNYFPLLQSRTLSSVSTYTGANAAQVEWILSNEFPNGNANGTYPWREYGAAVQAAIWNFTNGLFPIADNDTGNGSIQPNGPVTTLAQQIISQANSAVQHGWKPVGTQTFWVGSNTMPQGILNTISSYFQNNDGVPEPGMLVTLHIADPNNTGATFSCNASIPGPTSGSQVTNGSGRTTACLTAPRAGTFYVTITSATQNPLNPGIVLSNGSQDLIVASYSPSVSFQNTETFPITVLPVPPPKIPSGLSSDYWNPGYIANAPMTRFYTQLPVCTWIQNSTFPFTPVTVHYTSTTVVGGVTYTWTYIYTYEATQSGPGSPPGLQWNMGEGIAFPGGPGNYSIPPYANGQFGSCSNEHTYPYRTIRFPLWQKYLFLPQIH